MTICSTSIPSHQNRTLRALEQNSENLIPRHLFILEMEISDTLDRSNPNRSEWLATHEIKSEA